MKNFMTALWSSTCYMEHGSSGNIIADGNDDNKNKGQCHHFSIREYVRRTRMSNTLFCSLPDENIDSSLVNTKTYRQWNCKHCRDKLDFLYNRTLARTLNEFPRVPEHAIRKELSQAKGSVKCHSPSSYNEESTEVDRAMNDLYESTLMNQENGSTKYLPPSWGNKESTEANPIINGNSVKSLPVKRKDATHANLHDKDKNVIKTYKRRKNTKVRVDPAFGDFARPTKQCVQVSPGKSEQTLRKTTEHEEDECVGISIKEASTRVQSEKSNPEFSQLEQQQSCHLHNEQPLSTTEDEEDYCVIISEDEFLAILQSRKSQNHLSKKGSQNPEFTSVHDQQFLHLHNEVSLGNATEDEARQQSVESHNKYNREKFTSYRDNSNLNGSFPPTMDISARYHHPQNFSKPVGLVPRSGVLSVMVQKEVGTYSESCGTQSGYRVGMSEEETPCQMYNGENLALSNSQQVPANCSPQHLDYATSVAIPEPARESSHSTKGKSKMVDDPSDKSSEQDIVCACLCLSIRGHECCTSWKEFQN